MANAKPYFHRLTQLECRNQTTELLAGTLVPGRLALCAERAIAKRLWRGTARVVNKARFEGILPALRKPRLHAPFASFFGRGGNKIRALC
jgi:hypothetical protein